MDTEQYERDRANGDNDDDGRIVFYRSRGHGLAPVAPRPPNESPLPARGFFRGLSSSKSMPFYSIVVLCIMVMVYTLFTANTGGVKKVDGLEMRINALVSGDNESYLTLRKTITGKAFYTGEAVLVVSCPGASEPYTETIYISRRPEERFGFLIPFAGKPLSVLMELGEKKVSFKVMPR